MLIHDQTLQSLVNLHPDYPAFAESMPPELVCNAKPLPEGLAADVLAFIRKESPELSNFLDGVQDGSQPSKFFPGAETILPLTAVLFLLRTHIRIELPNLLIEHKPMEDGLLTKIFETLSKYMGSK